MNRFLIIFVSGFALANSVAATAIDFSDLSLSADSFYNGGPTTNTAGWSSNGAHFANSFTDHGTYTSWSGFAYSNVNDTSTAGFGNQYAAYTGTGVGGTGSIYAVGFGSSTANTVGAYSYFNLPNGKTPVSVEVTNTTYSALSMLNGDSFAKKFGGASGNDPDFFKVTFHGYTNSDMGGTSTGSVDFYLADYRFVNNLDDYVVDTWESVDLTSLGNAKSIGFSFDSSDTGSFGINTPTYFALGEIETIPEPTTALLLMGGAGLLLARRRRVCG